MWEIAAGIILAVVILNVVCGILGAIFLGLLRVFERPTRNSYNDLPLKDRMAAKWAELEAEARSNRGNSQPGSNGLLIKLGLAYIGVSALWSVATGGPLEGLIFAVPLLAWIIWKAYITVRRQPKEPNRDA